jgi:serine/threonine-protein kinase
VADEHVTLAGGRYELVAQVGAGGMGEVYEGIDHETHRRVAIKRLRVNHLTPSDGATRFDREILATAQITSRHVVALHDAGVDDDGAPFMVMDLLVGEDLGSIANRLGTLPVELAVRLVAQACEGLIAAHAAGIVHRDIKPSNLFLTASTPTAGRIVKILDFGIARIRNARAVDDVTELTRTGAIIGSPLYMAPEQLRGAKTLDDRADLWSLGVVLYRLLCGSVPHSGDSIADLLITVCSEPAPPLRDRAPWVPQGIAELVHRTLQIEVEARIPSARAFAEELERWLPEGTAINDAMIVAREPSAAPPTANEATARGAVATPKDPESIQAPRPSARLPPARPRAPSEPEAARTPAVRLGFLLALVLAGIGGGLGYRALKARARRPPPRPPMNAALELPADLINSAAGRWFATVRTHCNSVELNAVLDETPPPSGDEGVAFSAACAAIAGDLALARNKILSLDAQDRAYAMWPTFAVAHPLADRRTGDRGVAEIMRLVLEFWPENFQALYHASLTEFITGDARALGHLTEFRRLYPKQDAFRATADALLGELAAPSQDCARVVVVDPEGNTIHPQGC